MNPDELLTIVGSAIQSQRCVGMEITIMIQRRIRAEMEHASSSICCPGRFRNERMPRGVVVCQDSRVQRSRSVM
jgi:hypothetical protein